MVPDIARNTILLTGAIAVGGVIDFIRMLKSYKKKKP
jgi:hypothetical protein